MMLPALVILAAISILPLFYIIWMSLNNLTLLGGTGISSHWTGLGNWGLMFTDPGVWAGWLAMVIYFIGAVRLRIRRSRVAALVICELVTRKNLLLSRILIPMLIAS